MSDFNKWDYHFMLQAKLWATMSKDPSRKIGAVIVNGKKPVASGYNGFPSLLLDKEEYLSNREIKYKRTLHAEVNALHNAAEFGIPVKDCVMYVYGLPTCSNCALHIISSKIKKVVYCDINSGGSIWIDEGILTKELFEEANIELHEMSKIELDTYEKMCYYSLNS